MIKEWLETGTEYMNGVTLDNVKSEFTGCKLVRRGKAYFITTSTGNAIFGIQKEITNGRGLSEIADDLRDGFNLRVAGELENSEYPSLYATICRQDAEELTL